MRRTRRLLLLCAVAALVLAVAWFVRSGAPVEDYAWGYGD